MIKRPVIFLPAVILSQFILSQTPVGSWSDHLNYSSARGVVQGKESIYASTGSSVLIYNREFNELKKLSKVNGLSETGISAIGWSDEAGVLIIAYNSTNLDLAGNNLVYNIPDIKNKYIPGKKKVNKIITSGKHAYLACSFGIVVLDLGKKEIRDTWKPGPGTGSNEVFDISVSGGRLYAATENGVWSAGLSAPGLAWSGNWAHVDVTPDPFQSCNLVLHTGSALYCNMPGSDSDILYSVTDHPAIFSSSPGKFNHSIDITSRGFLVSSNNSIEYFNNDGSLIKRITTYGWGAPSASQCVAVGEEIWIADLEWGLVRSMNSSEFSRYIPEGPASDHSAEITWHNGSVLICAGGVDDSWNRLGRPFQISVYTDNRYTNMISGQAFDAMRVCFDPVNTGRFFVSTWGNGLHEYRGGSLVRIYDETNSPLPPGPDPGDGIRICGMVMDKTGNLFMARSGQRAGISILRPDGSWIVNYLTADAPLAGDMISASNGQKWVTLPGSKGVMVTSDNGTRDIFTDDKSWILTIKDQDGTIINNAYCLAEDREGNIWIGTDSGPVVYSGGKPVTGNDVSGYRFKVPRDDNSGLADYMLGTETITAISIDGANRKWLGTKSSGLYLISADGSGMIKNYNASNSPLPSDSISSIAVDNLTGEVWAGTSKGIVSVRELATSGSENYGKIYAFPNPVREDFQGNLTITGLMSNTRVKITDVSGNLVYETVSEGGQAAWDLTTFTGKRVSTGVYLILCSNTDGSGSSVTKVLVIGN